MLALLALLGCDHDIPNVPADKHDNAIAFDYVSTRADLSSLEQNGFSVWAFIDNDVTQNYPLMDNQHVEYQDGEWVYSPAKYWLENTNFSFVGAYPYDADNSYFRATDDGSVELSISETPSDVDFLMATYTVDTNVEYNTIVPLQFQHALTSVGLKIWRDEAKHTNDQMRITKVTLSNIRKSGAYSSATSEWTYGTDKLTAVYTNNSLSDTDNIGAAMLQENGTLTTGGIAADPFGQMMLLPQTIGESNSIALRIEYELKRLNAADWEEAELEAVLPNITLNAGQRYTFNVVLSSVTDITFYYIQTKVDPWGTPQVGGTVIIK